MRRIGVYGGTFDPIHIGHLVAAAEVQHVLGLDQVLFLPAGEPPHKTQQWHDRRAAPQADGRTGDCAIIPVRASAR